MTNQPTEIFNFLRGAIRGAYGVENFRELKFLIIGMSSKGQSLLNKLCFGGVDIKFQDESVINHYKTFTVCHTIDVHEGQPVDVIIDFNKNTLCVKEQSFLIENIGRNSYTQGIHEYYL